MASRQNHSSSAHGQNPSFDFYYQFLQNPSLQQQQQQSQQPQRSSSSSSSSSTSSTSSTKQQLPPLPKTHSHSHSHSHSNSHINIYAQANSHSNNITRRDQPHPTNFSAVNTQQTKNMHAGGSSPLPSIHQLLLRGDPGPKVWGMDYEQRWRKLRWPSCVKRTNSLTRVWTLSKLFLMLEG